MGKKKIFRDGDENKHKLYYGKSRIKEKRLKGWGGNEGSCRDALSYKLILKVKIEARH